MGSLTHVWGHSLTQSLVITNSSVTNIMSLLLSDDELTAYKKSFYQCFDRDKDGTLTTQELGNYL